MLEYKVLVLEIHVFVLVLAPQVLVLVLVHGDKVLLLQYTTWPEPIPERCFGEDGEPRHRI